MATTASPVQLDQLDSAVTEVQRLLADHSTRHEGGPETSVAVQRKGGGAGDPDRVHAAAVAGTRGGAGTLPHGERIQQAFGRYDVSKIAAYHGGAASEACDAMGARAYASGDSVAFKGAPDLHTAAHEAAHVVQQRGGVQLAGGVGQVGDAYERHADQVADAVVQGKSAEGLLSQHASPGSHAHGAVQRVAVGVPSSLEKAKGAQPRHQKDLVDKALARARTGDISPATMEVLLELTESVHGRDRKVKVADDIAYFFNTMVGGQNSAVEQFFEIMWRPNSSLPVMKETTTVAPGHIIVDTLGAGHIGIIAYVDWKLYAARKAALNAGSAPVGVSTIDAIVVADHLDAANFDPTKQQESIRSAGTAFHPENGKWQGRMQRSGVKIYQPSGNVQKKFTALDIMRGARAPHIKGYDAENLAGYDNCANYIIKVLAELGASRPMLSKFTQQPKDMNWGEARNPD